MTDQVLLLDEEQTCRICQEPGKLLLVCQCTTPVHAACLYTWITTRRNHSANEMICEICKQRYRNLPPVIPPPEYEGFYCKLISLTLITLGILGGCYMLSGYGLLLAIDKLVFTPYFWLDAFMWGFLMTHGFLFLVVVENEYSYHAEAYEDFSRPALVGLILLCIINFIPITMYNIGRFVLAGTRMISKITPDPSLG
jgi:hypothetical protein